MSRQAFTTDALFGMPGVPAGPGSCVINNEGKADEAFAHPWTEATYQVWLRGYKSKALAVRDKMKQSIGESEDWYDESGFGAFSGDLELLFKEWQETGFIPKRPGD